MTPRKVKWTALALFILSLGLYLPSLGSPTRLYWDESIHVNGARNLIYNPPPHTDQMHPPLGREILAASLYLFGDNPRGARVLSVLAGAGSIALIFLIAFQLTSRLLPSLIPPLLLLTDPLFFIHARIGMLDIFVTFFMVLSFWIFLKIYFRPVDKRTFLSYYILGTSLGVAFAVKTVSVVLYPIFFGILVWGILKNSRGDSPWSPSPRKRGKGQPPERRGFAKSRNKLAEFVESDNPAPTRFYRIQILQLIFAFTLPTLVLFYLPYALIHFSLEDMKDHLLWYWDFMRSFKGNPAVMSRWYEWLLVKQPIWYFKGELGSFKTAAVVCTGNYLFWISAELIFLISLIFYKQLPKITYILHAIIAAQFAFWALKPTTHLYYMLTIVPFYALLIGVFLNFLLERFPDKKKYILFDAALYLACCLFIFSYYFPLIRGMPLDSSRVNQFLFPGTEGPGTDSQTSFSP